MKKTNKRDHIISASLNLIAVHGFYRTPVSLIAKKAKVGTGTIYRYFESKDILITNLHNKLESEIFAAITEGYSDKKTIRERYIYLCTKLLRYFLENPVHFRFLEQYYHSPYGMSIQKKRILGNPRERDEFGDLFEQGIAQQVLKDLPIFVHADITFGPLFALARDVILGIVVMNDVLIMKSIEACWDGLKR